MIQVVSVLGAITILAAYAASQCGRLRATSVGYTSANVVGAAVLTFVAADERQWGFLRLDGIWTLVGLAALARMLRSSAPA